MVKKKKSKSTGTTSWEKDKTHESHQEGFDNDSSVHLFLHMNLKTKVKARSSIRAKLRSKERLNTSTKPAKMKQPKRRSG